MNSTIIVAMLGLFGAGVGAISGLLIAARRFSGTIQTTEASKLWDAQEEFRKAQQEDNRLLRAEHAECRQEINRLRDKLDESEKVRFELMDRIAKLELEVNGA